jgi:hypothetical protein
MTRIVKFLPEAGSGTIRRMVEGMAACALALTAPAAAHAQAGIARIERAMDLPPNGEPRPYIDPGPAKAKIGTGAFLIRILPAHEVRNKCPAGIDWYSIACTIPVGDVILIPDEESSGLSTEQWLDLLRHEILHALGLDFHKVRP